MGRWPHLSENDRLGSIVPPVEHQDLLFYGESPTIASDEMRWPCECRSGDRACILSSIPCASIMVEVSRRAYFTTIVSAEVAFWCVGFALSWTVMPTEYVPGATEWLTVPVIFPARLNESP